MHEGHRKRKKEYALKNGFESLENHEILEVLLYHSIPRSDTNPTAHRLLDYFGGDFSRVLDADLSELRSIEGVGDSSAFLLKLIPEVFRRYEISKSKKKINIGSWEDMENYTKSLFVGKSVEQFYCMCVSSRRNLISTRLLMTGLADQVDITIKEIVKEAIARGASDIVVAHNHPYGSPVFSNGDIIFTGKLIEALRLVDINLVDHIVVSGNECTSYFKSCT